MDTCEGLMKRRSITRSVLEVEGYQEVERVASHWTGDGGGPM